MPRLQFLFSRVHSVISLQLKRMSATASSAGDPWKKRSVVSSFIMKLDDAEPKVALFQRSDKVSTYR